MLSRWFSLVILFSLLYTEGALAQDGMGSASADWFGVLELPFLFIAVWFGFRTASALQGGVFGKGINLMAWGFLVMAIGHLHMKADRYFSFNLFNTLFGQTGGFIVWIFALMTTWALAGLGFYSLYKASRA
jgi:hypothetical protein